MLNQDYVVLAIDKTVMTEYTTVDYKNEFL